LLHLGFYFCFIFGQLSVCCSCSSCSRNDYWRWQW